MPSFIGLSGFVDALPDSVVRLRPSPGKAAMRRALKKALKPERRLIFSTGGVKVAASRSDLVILEPLLRMTGGKP